MNQHILLFSETEYFKQTQTYSIYTCFHKMVYERNRKSLNFYSQVFDKFSKEVSLFVLQIIILLNASNAFS